jgi:anthraniloyl-CoA monooxygenase
VGGGPAGLYSGLLLKSRRPSDEVTVLERNRAGATHGWGVVFWDDLLDALYRNDPVSARALRDAAHLWKGQEVHLSGGRVAQLGGYGYSIGRARMLEILAARAAALGVDVRYETPVDDPAELAAGADLVVAADGVGSVLRDRRATPRMGSASVASATRHVPLRTVGPDYSLRPDRAGAGSSSATWSISSWSSSAESSPSGAYSSSASYGCSSSSETSPSPSPSS